LAVAAAGPDSWQRAETGLVARPATGPEAEIRLAVYGGRIVRVTTLPAADAQPARSLMVTAAPAHAGFTIRETPGHVSLSTPQVSAGINFSMSGIPDWTHDIGGYTMEARYASHDPAHVSRQYQNGAFARVPMAWNDATRTLTIGARQGRYPDMAARRTIRVIWYDSGHARPVAFDGPGDESIVYAGAEVRLRRR
jgi:hypothetical protein